MEKECCEEEVQPYRKTDYKPIIYVFRRVDVVFVYVVYPVAVLGAVFCVICSLLMFVSDASGDHMVETYSNMGLVMSLYVVSIASFSPCC